MHEVIRPPWRNVVQKFVRKIAMRIYQADAVAGGDVLNQQIANQCSFPDASFADDVNVVAAVRRAKFKKRGLAAPSVAFSNVDGWVHGARANRHSCRAIGTPSCLGCGGAVGIDKRFWNESVR